MDKLKLGLAALAVSAFPAVASAATFDFTSYSDGAVETLVETDGGVTVSITAGTYAFDTILDTDVDGLGDLAVSTQDGAGFFSGDAGIGVVLAGLPGIGPNVNGLADLLTFTFDQVVSFESITFGNVNNSDDFDLFVDGALQLSDSGIAGNNPYSLSGLGLFGTTLSIGADALNDSFNIQSLTVAPVPLPAGGMLLLTGLAGFALARRRRAAS